MDHFEGKRVVATIKMDGENTNMYSAGVGRPGYIHARSLESNPHPSRTWVRALYGRVASEIPPGWHISGENLYAKHSIHYQHLKSYFYLFTAWNENNQCFSWDDTLEFANLLGLTTVPLFYRGIWDRDAITEAFEAYREASEDEVEGYVVRFAEAIHLGLFQYSYAKWVRANHVQTDKFWMTQPVVKNCLGK